VGIIGKNGSGKSTLLQMICGTLTPTSGKIETHGRVAALLELGSGFNPEFTGRENVYLNAAILGLSRQQIDDRIEIMLEFADIGGFIDQPVKTYSSGMFVRLAFSVIAHVDPDILIIDEALSVGDAFFQSKCAAAMRHMIKRGTTILFVSHDTSSVKALCDKAILLEHGSMVAQGQADEVVEHYYSQRVKTFQAIAPATQSGGAFNDVQGANLNDVGDIEQFDRKAAFQRVRNGNVEFLNVRLLDLKGHDVSVVEFKQRVTLRMVVVATTDVPILGLAYHIRDMKGVELVYSDTGVESESHLINLAPDQCHVVDWSFQASLHEGEYNFSTMASIPLDLGAGAVDVCDFVPFALQFRVVRGPNLPIYAAVHWDNQLSIRKVEFSRNG
jgi:lipopolysaccharide transport system ATP-binding protein